MFACRLAFFAGLFLVLTCLFRPIHGDELNLDEIPLDDPSVSASIDSASDSGKSAASLGSADSSAASESGSSPKKSRRNSFFDLLMAGGLIGYVIILLSLAAVALAIEHGYSIRRSVLMPEGFADTVLKMLSQGQLGQALQLCREHPSVLAQILESGMKEYELGWSAVEKGAEQATAEQAARLYRKIDYLNVIGNISPMLGLLGTVVGMVFAFQNLAESEGYSRAADLAEGIYLALVTTVEGLIVAIPSLAAFSFFSNRIAMLISETTFVAEQVLYPIKKSLINSKKI